MATRTGTAGQPSRPEPEPFFRFQSRRSVVYGTRGIVACTNPLAAQAGLSILEAGGNAADAAVAVSAVLAVVDPPMTGIGGDSFALYFEVATGRVRGLNASGRTPQAATREIVCESVSAGGDNIDWASQTLPHKSVHAVTVPGGAASWVDAVEQFGSGRVTLAQVLAPAIRLAETGFPVSKLSAHYWQVAEADLKTRSPTAGAANSLLKRQPTGAASAQYRSPREGELMHNKDLAGTLRQLADKDKAGFYEGPVAQAIVDVCQAAGGRMTLDDLKRHASLPPDISEALSMPVGVQSAAQGAGAPRTASSSSPDTSLRLWEHPPNGQGIVALLTMGILEELERSGKIQPLRTMEHNAAPYLHAVVSALRIAFADAGWFVADPDDAKGGQGTGFDPQSLLNPAYLAKRAALFDPDRACTAPVHGSPDEFSPERQSKVHLDDVACLSSSAAGGPPLQTSDTVYLAVTDAEGNGCSFVNSMADLFGSCLVPQGTGFALANRAHMFRLGPADHPNVYAGGKRAYNTIIPAIVTRQDQGLPGLPGLRRLAPLLDTVFGVMGGFMQPQGHVQVLLNMHVFGMDPQTALDAPRVCVAPNYFWSPDRAAAATGNTTSAEAVGQIYVEEGLSSSDGHVVEDLRRLGYVITEVRGFARSLFGRGQVIRAEHDVATGDHVYAAGSDGRGDGHAVPLLG